MKKGKLLEITIEIIHKSLKGKSDTKVFRNHKLKNTSGDLREFDIVLKSTINKYNFITVVECKDYKRPVSVDKIDAFVTKCNHIPEINKKVFVSKNGYQKAAKSSATNYGVELYQLEELNAETVKNWSSVALIQPITSLLILREIGIKSDPMISKDLINIRSLLHIENKEKNYVITDFIREKIKEAINLNPNFENEFGLANKQEITEHFVLNIDSLSNLYLLDSGGSKYYITNMHVRFTIKREVPKRQIKIERIVSVDKKLFSNVVTHETDGPNSIKLVMDEKKT